MLRTTVRRFAVLGGAFGLAALIVSVPTGGAQAASSADPPGNPGGGAQYGMSPLELPQLAEQDIHGKAQNCLSAGGFSNEEHWATDGGPASGSGARAIGAVTVCDPFVTPQPQNNNALGYVFDIQYNMLGDTRSPTTGGFVDAGNGSGPSGSGTAAAVCADSSWSLPADQTTQRNGYTSMQGDSNQVNGFTYHQGFGAATNLYNQCKFLVSVTFTVWTYHGFASPGTPHTVVWTAIQAASPRTYINAADATVACLAPDVTADMSPGCGSVIAAQPGHWCDNPPQPQWSGDPFTDFASWIPKMLNNVGPTVAFYGQCLFIPKNGFDSGGDVSKAFSIGPIGRVSSSLNSITTGFNNSAGCGPLIPAQSGGPLVGFGVSTCDWPVSFTGAVRTILTVAVLGLSAWWIIQKFIEITIGIVNKKIVIPVAKKSDD